MASRSVCIRQAASYIHIADTDWQVQQYLETSNHMRPFMADFASHCSKRSTSRRRQKANDTQSSPKPSRPTSTHRTSDIPRLYTAATVHYVATLSYEAVRIDRRPIQLSHARQPTQAAEVFADAVHKDAFRVASWQLSNADAARDRGWWYI